MRKILSMLLVVMFVVNGFGVNTQAKEVGFSDLKKSHWAYNDIMAMHSLKLVSGVDGKFYAEKSITRAEFVAILTRIMGVKGQSPSFSDSKNHWASQVIGAAEQSGIIDKAEYGKSFAPNKPITRREMAKMIALAFAQKQEYKELLTTFKELYHMDFPFVDAKDMNQKDVPYIALAFGTGIIGGDTQAKFNLGKNATRAEATAMLHRFLKEKERHPNDFLALRELKEVAETGSNIKTISDLIPRQENYKGLVIEHPNFTATMKRLYVMPYNQKSLFEKKFVVDRNNIPARWKGAQFDGIVVGVVDIRYKKENLEGYFVYGQSLVMATGYLFEINDAAKKFGFTTRSQDTTFRKSDRKSTEVAFYALFGEDDRFADFYAHGGNISHYLYTVKEKQ